MKKVLNKEVLNWIVTVFIIVQSVIELTFLCKNESPHIFGMTIPTLTRLLFVFVLGIYWLYNFKLTKKHFFLLGYLFLILIYTILHHFNALNFYSLVPGNFDYSLKSELFYFIRMLIPLFLIILGYNIKLSKKQIKVIIISLLFYVAGSIIISDLLVIGTGSYSKGTIRGSIITWFTNGYQVHTYYYLACKGFFHDPNRLSAFLILLECVSLCYLDKNRKLYIGILIGALGLAMFIVGTKVATFGYILLLLCFILINLITVFVLKNNKITKKYFIGLMALFFASCCLLNYAPYKSRIKEDASSESNSTGELVVTEQDKVINYIDSIDNITKEELAQILYDNRELFRMNEGFFLHSYPVRYDPFFWKDIYKLDVNYRYDYRYVEESMLSRVKEINDNKYDNYFGITFTRMSNIFELEKDFVSHYYSLGIIGAIIFLSPYILVLLYILYKLLTNIKKLGKVKNLIIYISLIAVLFAGYFSGNVIDSLFVMIPYGLLMGCLLKMIKEPNNEN